MSFFLVSLALIELPSRILSGSAVYCKPLGQQKKRKVYRIYSNKRPGALEVKIPENDVLETKCGQIYQIFNLLKPFCMAVGNLFTIKIERGRLLGRGRLLEQIRYSHKK